ncbi:5-formyltetrahydrofolate cyclo-ligase [Candidozyma pseudohaemuli]|uniref:5-formyltetrahydrofolate cyclo-ligase n=1 Tax=Candidozyma pseudohaemuli TaxID=418784 RepID=A0A2P7YP87_9ASCO|nr:5-formyltetrahydrofolate cyclo-ligase [[Candida] pseudohaemulonii]PSK37784.1 5-formyltetrahydrofolate cyclo-ligase [[Candida] pseudohaemulonii]
MDIHKQFPEVVSHLGSTAFSHFDLSATTTVDLLIEVLENDLRDNLPNFQQVTEGLAEAAQAAIDGKIIHGFPEVTSSGLPEMDTLMDGGYTHGQVSEIFGVSGSGKSHIVGSTLLAAHNDFIDEVDLELVNQELNFSSLDENLVIRGGCDLFTTKPIGSDRKLFKTIERHLDQILEDNQLSRSIDKERKQSNQKLHGMTKHENARTALKVNPQAYSAVLDYAVKEQWNALYAITLITASIIADESGVQQQQFEALASVSQRVRSRIASSSGSATNSSFLKSQHEQLWEEGYDLYKNVFPSMSQEPTCTLESFLVKLGAYNINNLDSSIFLIQSHLNHNCEPNVEVITGEIRRDTAIEVVATVHSLQPRGKYSLLEPTSGLDVLQSGNLDLILVPGVAFTQGGKRLGRGAGYYDKFLSQYLKTHGCTPYLIGLAFKQQIVDDLPQDDHDWWLNEVLVGSPL